MAPLRCHGEELSHLAVWRRGLLVIDHDRLCCARHSTAVSHDGAMFAYGLSEGGSDWVTIRVRDVATGAHSCCCARDGVRVALSVANLLVPTGATLSDVVPWVKFSSIAWTHDGKGFFYSRYPSVAGIGTNIAAASAGSGGDDSAAKHAGTEVDKNQNHMVRVCAWVRGCEIGMVTSGCHTRLQK